MPIACLIYIGIISNCLESCQIVNILPAEPTENKEGICFKIKTK